MCMVQAVSQGNIHHEIIPGIKEMPGVQSLTTMNVMNGLPVQSMSVAVQPEASVFKLWEVDHVFRCPVVGMCLELSEQRQLLKRNGIAIKDKTPYEIHEILVAGAESDSRLSQRITRLLNRKFGRRASELYGLSEKDFMQCWKTAFDSGDYLAELWAGISRRDLSESSRKDIFGTIHMAMHNQADISARMTRQLMRTDVRLKAMEARIKELLVSRRTLVKENETFKRMIQETKNKVSSTGTMINCQAYEQADRNVTLRISELEQENRKLNRLVSDQAETLKVKEEKLVSLIGKIAKMSDEMDMRERAEYRFKKETEETLHDFSSMNSCDADCPAFDLCSKRVLIVGGIERMEALYRQIIERSGGVFEYHAGHMKGGGKHLENRLKRSDIVLCPVNCNSHAACVMVKHLGKKHNKPVHMLSSFSLSTVSQVIKTCGYNNLEKYASL